MPKPSENFAPVVVTVTVGGVRVAVERGSIPAAMARANNDQLDAVLRSSVLGLVPSMRFIDLPGTREVLEKLR